MADGTATTPSQREDRTIILAIAQEEYEKIIGIPAKFRAWINENYRHHPELFPETFEEGYKLHDKGTSEKNNVLTRRIKLRNGQAWTVHPSFVMPRMTGYTQDVAYALYLRKFGVPYEGLTYVFGKDDNYWYRMEVQFGRKSIVATTVKTVPIPQDLLADEHHSWVKGEKVAIATTVAQGVVLGSEISPGFSKDELEKGYGAFAAEAKQVEPKYAPKTVNTDGWSGTQGAWKALFPAITVIRCFLHAWLRIRERGKKLKKTFFDLGERVWAVYYSETKRAMGQRIRRLREWATLHLSGVVLEKTLDLCDKEGEWSLWYERGCEDAYTTSNALDRLMRSQNRYFDRGQHFHGTLESANLRSRSWAILHNYWDWGRRTRKLNAGSRCPAERLNGKRYADDWLENLLVATSAVARRKNAAT